MNSSPDGFSSVPQFHRQAIKAEKYSPSGLHEADPVMIVSYPWIHLKLAAIRDERNSILPNPDAEKGSGLFSRKET